MSTKTTHALLPSPMSVLTRTVPLIIGLLLLTTFACGSDEPTPEPPTAEAAPVNTPDDQPQNADIEYKTTTFDGLGDTKGFAGNSFNSGFFDTRELQGKPIVINFWFPSCPPCRNELPEFEEAFQEYGPPAGGDIQFVGVQQLGLDSIDDGIQLFDELGITFPSVPDSDFQVQVAFDIFSFPTTIFLDQDHNLFRKWQGALNGDKLHEIIEEILSAQSSTHLPDTDSQPASQDEPSQIQPDDHRAYPEPTIFQGLGDAPGFHGETYKHGTIDTSQLHGKPIVINFWYPSCPPCRAEIPNFQHAHQNYGQLGGGDVVIIGIQSTAIDTPAEGEEFFDGIGATYPSIVDTNSQIHIAYQITSAPTTFFLDREHNVVSIHQGYIRHNQLTEMLDRISQL